MKHAQNAIILWSDIYLVSDVLLNVFVQCEANADISPDIRVPRLVMLWNFGLIT